MSFKELLLQAKAGDNMARAVQAITERVVEQ